MSMSTSIYCLTPEAAARAEELVRALEKAGIRHKVTSTRRTTDEQIALYSQGRAPLQIVQLLRQHAGLAKLQEAENKYVVTQLDGVNRGSAHQDGKAIDIAVLAEIEPTQKDGKTAQVLAPSWDYSKTAKQYRAIADLAKHYGWNCGADWAPIDPKTGLGADPPHHELG